MQREINRAATLYTAGSKTRTMMQPCASAAKLRSGGPILPYGMTAMEHISGSHHLEPSSAPSSPHDWNKLTITFAHQPPPATYHLEITTFLSVGIFALAVVPRSSVLRLNSAW